jgi:hypothetical protein
MPPPGQRVETPMDTQRLKSLAHYICRSCAELGHAVTIAQINDILWRADGQTYLRLGRAVVGEDYVWQLDGPVCVNLAAVIEELAVEGHIRIRPQRTVTVQSSKIDDEVHDDCS